MAPSRAPSPSRRAVARRRGRGSRRRWPWFVFLVALACGGLFGLAREGFLGRGVGERLQASTLGGRASREVTLYFADPRWTRLVPEPRRVSEPGGVLETIRVLVEALAQGPREGGAPVLPEGALVRGAYLGQDGLAVVDFEEDLASFNPGGASGELLTVMSVVQTIAENVPGVRSVQILVGGKARETLAGHIKISEPLSPDSQLVQVSAR